MSDPLRISEDMLLNFDGWLGKQDEPTRTGIQQVLNSAPDPEAEKKTIASQYAVAAQSNGAYDLPTINDRWDLIRGGYAENKGGEYLAVKDDPADFHAQLAKDAAKQRDERWLIQGQESDVKRPGDKNDDFGKASREQSLSTAMFNGVVQGKSSAEAYADWEPNARSQPGYSGDRLDAYLNAGQDIYQQTYAKLAPVLPLARDAFTAVSAGKDLEATSESLYPQIAQMDDATRRNFLAALRGLADAAPEQQRATFWSNMEKVSLRSGGGLVRGATAFASGVKMLMSLTPPEGDTTGYDYMSEEHVAPALKALGEHNLESDLRRVRESNYSPVKEVLGDYLPHAVERGIYGIPGAVEFTAMALVPVAGIPATFATLTSQAYDEQRFRLQDAGMADMDASLRAAALAPVIAAAETALQLVGAKSVTGQFPALNRALLAIGDKAGGGVTGYLSRATGHLAFGVANMKAQELMPPLVDAMASALDNDVPGVTWSNGQNGVFDGWWSKTGESFIAMLPLALFGAVNSGARQVDALGKASDLQLQSFGAKPEDIAAFRAAQAGGPASAADAAEKLIAGRDGNSEQAKAATVELQKQTQEQAASAYAANAATMREAGVRSIVRDGDGWALVGQDGKTVRVGSIEAAQSIVQDLRQARSQKEADALVAIIDNWHGKTPEGTTRETTLTGDTLTHGEGGVMRNGELVKDFSAKDFAELKREAEMDPETRDAVHSIDGINRVSFEEKVADGAKQLVQRLEINQSPSAILTFLHESAEADFRAGLKTGSITLEETQRTIASVAEHFDPARARDAAEKAFRDRVQRVARGETNETETRETLTELAVADVIGRRKDGSAFPAGSVTTGLNEAVMNGARGLGPVRAFFQSVRQYFRGLFGTVAALKKARREGGAKEFDALIEKITGQTEQSAHERDAATEAEKLADDFGVAFKLGRVDDGFREATPDERKKLGIPPAWKDVKINPDPNGKLIVTGRDEKGRIQSRYSAAHSAAQAAVKFERVKTFDAALPALLKRISESLSSGEGREEASVLRLIYLSAFRNGSDADTGAKVKAYGASNLLASHVAVLGDTVTFDFIGKLGVEQKHSITDAGLAADISKRLASRAPADRLFATNDSKVRDYLQKSGDFKVHDLRTWNATNLAAKEVAARAPKNAEEFWNQRDEIGDIVAKKLGDTRKIVLDVYIDPAVFESEKTRLGITDEARPKRAKGAKKGAVAGPAIEGDAGLSGDNQLSKRHGKAAAAAGDSAGAGGVTEGGAAFRITAGNRLELIQNRIDASLEKDPEGRREISMRAQEKLAKFERDWSNERFTPKGDRIAPIEEQRTAKELDKEEAFHQADRFRQELEKLGLEGGDAARSKQYKDAMASQRFQEVFDGLTEKGWHEDDAAKMATILSQKDRAAFVEKVKRAFNTAKEAAYEWRRQEDEKQKADWSPRAALVRDLRTLDAILSVLPPEVRAKVGGFVKLAQLATDKARLAEIERRVEKISGLLETHLQKENSAALDKLVEKAQPSGDAGEKAKGKITVEGHRIFAEVEKVRELSDDEVQAQMAALSTREADELAKPKPDTKALLDIYRSRQILLGFGNFKEKTAKDGDASVKWLTKIYDQGRDAWLEIKAQEIAQREEHRQEAIKEAGGPGATLERQQTRDAEGKAGQRGTVGDFIGRKHQSWAQRLGSIFGTKSKTAERYEQSVHTAFTSKIERLIQRRMEQRDMLLRVFGAKKWGAVQDKLLKLQQRQEKSGVMKTEGRKLETVTLPVDKAQDILDGKAAPDAFGLTKADLPALQAEIDAWTADPNTRKENISIEVTKDAGKPVEQLLSELESVHLTMLARQPKYREALDRHGWTAESLAQMEKFLSPEAKQIRQWLFDRYEAEYASMNAVYQRMFGIDLPKVDFYAPGYFEHAGAVTEMDPTGSNMDPGGMQAGFLRQRKNHQAEPVLVDALQTYWNHAMMTEHWKAFAPVIQELRSVFGAVDVKHAITAHEGTRAHADVMAFVKQFEENGVRDAQSNRWVGRLTTALTRSALGFNIGTLMKHLPNALASLAEVPTMDFMRGMVRVMTGQAESSLGEIWKSDAIRNRLLQSYAPDLRQIAQGASAPGKWITLTKQMMNIGDVLDWGVARIPWVAGMFTTFSAAVAHECHFSEATKAGLDHASALRYAEEKTALTIARTAQPETIDRKSLAEIERAGAARLMMMFHTPERQQWGVAFSAIADAFHGKAEKGDSVRRLVSTWIVAPILMQTMVGLWRYAITDEDAEEAWDWKRYAGAVALGPLSGVFGLGQALEAIVHHATGAHGSKAGPIFSDMAEKLIRAGKHAADGEILFKDVLEFFGAAGLLTGTVTNAPTEGLAVLKRLYDAGHGLTTPKDELHSEKHPSRH